MTIVAGAIEDGGDFRCHLRPGKDCLRFVDGWVCSCRSHELYTHNQNNRDDGYDFKASDHRFWLADYVYDFTMRLSECEVTV